MPGNEIADKVHNFLDQDHLSKNQNQSQVSCENWPVLNNNPWVGNQIYNGTPMHSNSKNYTLQSSDYERGNRRQPSLVERLGTNITESTLRPDFPKSQPRNQQPSLNDFMQSPQGIQARSSPAVFLGEDTIPDRHHLMWRGLAIGSQQGKSPDHISRFSSNSERSETAEVPVNFDFLGGQQQLMRGQQPGLPQPRPRPQSGINDMQLWQQHLMYKQLQEFQRQQQLQQLDQSPALLNGTPIHDTSTYMRPGELLGSESKIPNTSQMFMVGNTNWVQRSASPSVQGFSNGLMLSHDQVQTLRSMGLAPQPLNQSLYGAPVASTRGGLNQYSHFQGVSHDYADMLTKAGGNQVEKPVMQSGAFNSFQNDQCAVFPDRASAQDGVSVSKQGFQGKNLFGHVPVQSLNNDGKLGNLQQMNPMHRSMPMQEEVGWSGNLQEKAMALVNPSQGLVGLDPTEEKILFSSDDGIWDASFGRSSSMGKGGYPHGNQLESTDYLNEFPSTQSGTWSALMQSAVAEGSSSDTGLQDEWSGLNFQKTEISTPTTLNDNGKQQKNWSDNNLQTASSLTSRAFPLFDDANTSPSDRNVLGFQQPIVKFPYDQRERVQTDASREHLHQSPKEASKWLDQSSQQKILAEGSIQVQTPMHAENISEVALQRQVYEQLGIAARSADMDLNLQNIQGSWARQQSMSSYNVSSQPCDDSNGWNIKEPFLRNGDAQSNDHKRGMHMERSHDAGLWKADDNCGTHSFPNSSGTLEQVRSSMSGSPQVHTEDSNMNNFTAVPNSNALRTHQETNQLVLNSHQLDYGQHDMVSSSMKFKGNENVGTLQHQLSNDPHVRESSMSNSDRVSDETYDKKRESSVTKEIASGTYISRHSHPDEHNVTASDVRENAWSGANDSLPLASGDQKPTGQVGRKSSGSRKFQYHPMGSLGVNVEPADTTKHSMHLQSRSHQVTRGTRNQEQGYLGQSKFAGHFASPNAMSMEKGHLADSQINAKGAEEAPSGGIFHGYESTVSGSFDRSAAFSNRSAVQRSQYLLERLHRVDQSRDDNTVKHFDSSDHSPPSKMPEAAVSDASIGPIQRSQSSAMQGFGLRLGPPTQRLAFSNHDSSSQASSQTVNDIKSRHVDSEAGDKDQAFQRSLASRVAVQSLPHAHEISQGEYQDNRSCISGQLGNETSHSSMQGNSATVSPSLSNQRNPLQHQYNSSPNRQGPPEPSINPSFASQADLSAHSKVASHFRQSHDSHDGAVADQSRQASLPGNSNRIPPFNLSPTRNMRIPVTSTQSYSIETGHSQPLNANSYNLWGSGQQPSAWTNISAQQRQSGFLPHKVPSSMFQSVGPSTSSLETTSWAPQKADDQGIKEGGNGPSEFGTCSINSQQFSYVEEQPVSDSSLQQIPTKSVDMTSQTASGSQGNEPVAKHLYDENSFGRGKPGQDPSPVFQTGSFSIQNTAASSRDIEAFGRSLKPSNVLHQSYSLLHQMQARKGAEIGLSKRAGKRIKASDCGADAQEMPGKTGQQLVYGYDTMVRDSADNELSVATQHTSFPFPEAKMLSFSSEGKEGQKAHPPSQLVGHPPSQDMITSGGNDPHNHSSNLSATYKPPSLRGTEHSQINPQMAPSWFEQYGTFKNGQILSMYDGLGNSSRTVKDTGQPIFFGKVSESLHMHTGMEQMNADNVTKVDIVCQSTTATMGDNNLSSLNSSPPDVGGLNLVVARPKKRKSATSEILSWHKEVTQGSQRLQSISVAEMDWAQATNRLIAKVDDEAEMIDDGPPTPWPRRRLILTTLLMQQILRSIPASILSADATSEYDSVTYFVAKLALGDACSQISCSGSDSRLLLDNGNISQRRNPMADDQIYLSMSPERLKTPERLGDQFFSKVVENFIGRARQLENDFRLSKRASILDLRVECQDLERVAIINRFAKFHGRAHGDGIEATSASGATTLTRRIFPQRYVTAFSMPRNPPEGVPCLSL